MPRSAESGPMPPAPHVEVLPGTWARTPDRATRKLRPRIRGVAMVHLPWLKCQSRQVCGVAYRLPTPHTPCCPSAARLTMLKSAEVLVCGRWVTDHVWPARCATVSPWPSLAVGVSPPAHTLLS